MISKNKASRLQNKVQLPLILIPSYFSIKNFLSKEAFKADNLVRVLGSIVFSIALMFSIYSGGFRFLTEISKQMNLIYLHPSLILNLFVFSLFVMLFFTNFFSAINQLFTSKDLDLIHQSPIKPSSFFLGNLLKTYLLTSWMSLLFFVPILLFLGKSENTDLTFYLLAIPVCIIFFSIPTSLAYCFAAIYPIIFPNKLAKTFIKFILLGLLLLVSNSLLLISAQTKGIKAISIDDLIRFLPVINFISNPMLPTYWVSNILGEILSPTGKSILTYLVALISFCILSLSMAYLSLKLFYQSSLTSVNSSSEQKLSSSRARQNTLYKLTSFLSSKNRGIIVKDYRIFARNVGQAGQMVMLLFLTASYLYIINFQVGFVSGLPETSRMWWINALTISNSCLEAFIALALGTRIIYPQWSLEGKSIWLLQASPVPIKDIFKAKLTTWYIPSSIFLATLFTLSLLALNASPGMLVIKFTSTLITTYGLISLGLGMGAYFSDFNKENPGEVTASFGSLLFMLLGFGLIFIDLIILSFIFSNSIGAFLAFDSTKNLELGPISYALGIIFIFINISVAEIAIYFGRKKLEKYF